MSSTTTSSSTTTTTKTGLVWYKSTDLRTLDHEPLHTAHKENTHVTHLFCFDPRFFGPAGGPSAPDTLKTGALRTRFLCEAVEDLKARLDGNLIVKYGKPEVEVVELAKALGVEGVYTHMEVTSEEVQVMKGVMKGLKTTSSKEQPKKEIKFRQFWGGNYLFHINDMPFDATEKGACPTVFTQFRKAVESKSRVRKFLPAPATYKPLPPPLAEEKEGGEGEIQTIINTNTVPFPLTLASFGFTSEEDLAPITNYEKDGRVNAESVCMFKGGETAALARVQHYMWEKDLLKVYKVGVCVCVCVYVCVCVFAIHQFIH
jgi:deoxyribodipyrimidine photo-lyase